MADVFIAHAEEDGAIAAQIADAMEKAGVSAWIYERNLAPGSNHLAVSDEEIKKASMVLVLISPSSCSETGSTMDEALWAKERGKRIIPLLYHCTREELAQKSPAWAIFIGPKIALALTDGKIPDAVSQILKSVHTQPPHSEPLSFPPLPVEPAQQNPHQQSVEKEAKREDHHPPRQRSGKIPRPLGLVLAVLLICAAGVGIKVFVDQSRTADGSESDPVVDAIEMDNTPQAPPAPIILQQVDENPSQKSTSGAKSMAERVAALERNWKTLVGFRSLEDDWNRIDNDTEAFNAWSDTRQKSLSPERAALEKRRGEIDAQQKKYDDSAANLKSRESQIDRNDKSAVEKFNQDVSRLNDAYTELKQAADAYKKDQTTYNESVTKDNKASESRQAELQRRKKDAQQRTEAQRKWHKEGGDETVWTDVNRCYADLHKMRRAGSNNSAEVEQWIDRIRTIRRDLGEHAQREETASPNGLLVCKAKLCDGEECYITIDNGSTSSSISDEMVDVLNLRKFVGGTTKLLLPNAIKIDAPQLLIPKASVEGNETWFIKAVVLKNSFCGVDGALGLSFLNRFDYAIRGGNGHRIELRPKQAKAETPAPDAFICNDPDDLGHAQQVFQLLVQGGIQPYLAGVSVQKETAAEQQRETDEKLSSAPSLVLVTSSVEHARRPWVEAEWGLFDHMLGQGIKKGILICLAVGDMKKEDFPEILQKYPFISTREQGWEEKLKKQIQPQLKAIY